MCLLDECAYNTSKMKSPGQILKKYFLYTVTVGLFARDLQVHARMHTHNCIQIRYSVTGKV